MHTNKVTSQKTPDWLKEGDKVAIVCTASFIKGNIDKALKTLESWGLKVVVGKTVSTAYHQYAGTDQLRALELQRAIDDPEIKAVFAARGGYGNIRIVDQIDFSAFAAVPKWIIGFSDVTVLHSHIQAVYGIPTIHGQMPKTFDDGTPASIESLRDALFGQASDIAYRTASSFLKTGTAEGILVGGNLALLHSVLGSVSDVDFSGKILFIEDVGEPYYNIDRMLWTLKRAKKLTGIKGLIVGGFTAMREEDPPFGSSIEEIVLEKVTELDIPIAFEFPAGHIENNHALIFGKNVKLHIEKNQVQLVYQQ